MKLVFTATLDGDPSPMTCMQSKPTTYIKIPTAITLEEDNTTTHNHVGVELKGAFAKDRTKVSSLALGGSRDV